MDRDKRWERIKIAYEGLVQGIGETTTTDKVIEVRYSMILCFTLILIPICTAWPAELALASLNGNFKGVHINFSCYNSPDTRALV